MMNESNDTRRPMGPLEANKTYKTYLGLAFEISTGVIEDITAEAPRRLQRREFAVEMCEDYEQTENFLKRIDASVKSAGMVFLQFVYARFWSHTGGLALSDLAGNLGFIPIKFFARELEESALGILLERMPSLGALFKDTTVVKVVENKNEFWYHLEYPRWSLLSFNPVLDVEELIDVGARPAKAGPLRSLRSVFLPNDPFNGWNSDESICHDNRWHVPEYPCTPTFSKNDNMERAIVGQLYAMITLTCRYEVVNHVYSCSIYVLDIRRYLCANNSEFVDLTIDDVTEFNYSILHKHLFVEKDERLPARYVVPKRDKPPVEEAVELELSIKDEEMQNLLEEPANQNTASSPEKVLEAKNPRVRGSVKFHEELFYRSFDFGSWQCRKEYAVKMRSWATMEKANEVPVLKISRNASRAMNRERCSEILQKVSERHQLPHLDGELPEPPRVGILKASVPPKGPLTGEIQVVHDNHNDDMTWNLLAHLRHHRKRTNSRKASPPPSYFRKRPGIQCHTTLAATLIRQYDQDGDYENRAMPVMTPSLCDPDRKRLVFPSYMNSSQILAAKKMKHTELRKLVEADAGSGELIATLKRERKASVPETIIHKSRAHRERYRPPPRRTASADDKGQKPLEKKLDCGSDEVDTQIVFLGERPTEKSIQKAVETAGKSVKNQEEVKISAKSASNQEKFPAEEETKTDKKRSSASASGLGKSNNDKAARKRTRSYSSSSITSSSGEEDDDSLTNTVIKGMTRRCRKYLKNLENAWTETKKPNVKSVGTQTSPLPPRRSVFDRLSI